MGGAVRNKRLWKAKKRQEKKGSKVNAIKLHQKKVLEPVFYSIYEDIDEIEF